MTLTITKTNFLDWYFESGSDQEQEYILNELGTMIYEILKAKNEVCLTTEDLFNESNHGIIPAYYIEEYKSGDGDTEIGELYETFTLILIDDEENIY